MNLPDFIFAYLYFLAPGRAQSLELAEAFPRFAPAPPEFHVRAAVDVILVIHCPRGLVSPGGWALVDGERAWEPGWALTQVFIESIERRNLFRVIPPQELLLVRALVQSLDPSRTVRPAPRAPDVPVLTGSIDDFLY